MKGYRIFTVIQRVLKWFVLAKTLFANSVSCKNAFPRGFLQGFQGFSVTDFYLNHHSLIQP